jgi:carboxymethylenebutenolidase
MDSTKKLRSRNVRLAVVMAGCLMATGYLAFGSSRWSAAAKPRSAAALPEDGQMVQYSSGDSKISAYVVKPASGDKHAAVIIVHDREGLNDETKEVARRFAEAGFVAFAPDLSRGAGAKAIGGIPLTQPVGDLDAAFAYLQKDSSVDAAKISAVGFGWGGWRVFKLAEDTPALSKGVVFYAVTPTDANLKDIHASILGNYAQYDFRITGNAAWTEKELGKKFTYHVYPKTDHGFFTMTNNDDNSAAAKMSWTKTVEFLKGAPAAK